MDELYILARAVLLDALEALGAHRDAIVLVGAQAVYLHVEDADLAVRPYTTDGDLVLDPTRLAESPPIEQVLMASGFAPKKSDSVGVWITHRASVQNPKTEVCIDLLVPASHSPGKGRRAARLIGYDSRVARTVVGLEGALVDLDRKQLGSLSEVDPRVFDVQVAGPAALLVAKLIKIDDRTGTDRRSDKDALDVLRLLRGVETDELAARMNRVFADEPCAPVASRALDILRRMFERRTYEGVQMAIRAGGDQVDSDELAVSCELLSSDLLGVLADRGCT